MRVLVGPHYWPPSGMAAPPFTEGALPRRTRCPRLTPAPILAWSVEGWAAFSAGTPHCTALIFLPGRSLSYELDGGYICPSIQPRSFLPVAQQITCSISFCPNSMACRNILWRMNGQWGPPAFHWGYSSRSRSASRQHSASLTDSPSLCASPLLARDLCHLLLYCSSNKAW